MKNSNSMKNNTKYIPFLLAVCLIAGIAIGTFYANHFSGNKLGIINTSSNKLNALRVSLMTNMWIL